MEKTFGREKKKIKPTEGPTNQPPVRHSRPGTPLGRTIIRLVPNADLFEITSVSQPGSNRNAAKAQRLRTFALPDRFITPHSQDKGRTVNILAAVIMEEISIILWQTQLWSCFPSGPDWMVETAAALEYMDQWRDEVLCNRAQTPIIAALLDTCGPAAGVGVETDRSRDTYVLLFDINKLRLVPKPCVPLHSNAPQRHNRQQMLKEWREAHRKDSTITWMLWKRATSTIKQQDEDNQTCLDYRKHISATSLVGPTSKGRLVDP
ncbi:hypothetical protein GGX14DRAFT_658327 [Mycena pura]|uniref:Uncharacterized protein n=1 Tax=Mycena pura TaxID=153505 RepID=A0AAD6YMK9_9AGAR|nr:hypothetical protein GGX14DRAFT_658327 [Mycena pura]